MKSKQIWSWAKHSYNPIGKVDLYVYFKKFLNNEAYYHNIIEKLSAEDGINSKSLAEVMKKRK